MPYYARRRATTRRRTPYRRTYRRRAYRRPYGSKNAGTRSNRMRSLIGRGGFMPQTLAMPFVYSETGTQIASGVAGGPGVYTVSLNSLYDPNVTGGGSQPRYFDTFVGTNNGTAPYNRYMVFAAKITVTFYPIGLSENANGYWRAGIAPRNSDASAPTDLDELMERPYAKTVALSTASGQRPRTLTYYTKIAPWWGKKDIADVNSLHGSVAASPASQVYCDIVAGPVNENLGQNVMFVDWKVKYYARLYTLNDVADS